MMNKKYPNNNPNMIFQNRQRDRSKGGRNQPKKRRVGVRSNTVYLRMKTSISKGIQGCGGDKCSGPFFL